MYLRFLHYTSNVGVVLSEVFTIFRGLWKKGYLGYMSVRKTYCFEKSLKIHEMWYTDSLKTKRSLNDFYHYLKSVRKTYCFENFESLKIHEITSTECRTIYLKKVYLPVSQILCCQLLQTSQDIACWRHIGYNIF